MDTLKATAVSFYTSHELSVAKAKLQKTAEKVGIDGLHCLKKRAGPNKAKAEADDIITILQLTDEQKLLNCLPSYVAANTDRLPTTPVESVDVVILAKKLHLISGASSTLVISILLATANSPAIYRNLRSVRTVSCDELNANSLDIISCSKSQIVLNLSEILTVKPQCSVLENIWSCLRHSAKFA